MIVYHRIVPENERLIPLKKELRILLNKLMSVDPECRGTLEEILTSDYVVKNITHDSSLIKENPA